MKALKEIVITYLAIFGFFLIVPFFMIFVAIAAYLTQGLLTAFGFSDSVVSGGMLAMAFLSILIFYNIYSTVRFKKWNAM